MTRGNQKERRRRMAAWAEYQSLVRVAKAFECSVQTVRNACREHGIAYGRHHNRNIAGDQLVKKREPSFAFYNPREIADRATPEQLAAYSASLKGKNGETQG